MIFKRGWMKIILLVLGCLIALPVFSYTVHAAEPKENKTVRVGYMIYEGYQEGGEGELKSGCAYEYYQKVRYYTGWEYEYVYGSINEMFEMLEKGEIDIMSIVTYTEEREEKYFFSKEPHGSEAFYLYAHRDDNSLSARDLSTLNGKTIGVTCGSYQEMYLVKWCDENKINCDIISYEYAEDLHNALTNREVDAIMDIRVLEDGIEINPWKSIYRFATESLYFAVSKSRPDILAELNEAQEQIIANEEFYAYDVMQKYHDGTNYHNTYLTPEQQMYAESCDVLRVGYLEGTNPVSFTDSATGKMCGLAAEYLEAMTGAYGLEFETVAYSDEKRLIEDLRDYKLDIILPLGVGYWSAENVGIALSSPIITLPMSVIYADFGKQDIFQRIAVIEGSVTQEGFVEQNYPNAEKYYVKNTQEALDAMEDGRADCYFVRSISMDLLNQKFQIDEKFHTMGLRYNMEVFMATRIEDTTLSIILDKGITLINDAQADAAKVRYAYDAGKTSLWEAIKDNMWIVAEITLVVILLFVVLVVVYRLKIEADHVKELQEARDRAEEARAEAERARHAKTDFLSQMSHDIRTPMNAIVGFTNFAKETDDIEVIKKEYIPKIETASNQLLLLINDVLEMSRIESGKMEFVRTDNDVIAMIKSVVTVMGLQAEEKGITIEFNAHVKDRCVHCDENHLNRVMMNLMSNAVKFTPSGGKVTMSVEQQPDDTPGCASYEIKVEDTGIGMSPEFIEKVFEPFERERTSTVSRMQGTGLGMAIVKSIVEAADDTITVESTLGKGTTFTLRAQFLLAKEEHRLANERADNTKKSFSLQEMKEYFTGKRILLVEDNEFNSTIAETILENAGFLVETASDGYVAVQKVVNAPTPDYYSFILMDIQMPVMNGYEATRAIRALDDERAEIKIIAVTANAFESDKQDAQEAGMDGHVSKPLDVNILYSTLLEIMNV